MPVTITKQKVSEPESKVTPIPKTKDVSITKAALDTLKLTNRTLKSYTDDEVQKHINHHNYFGRIEPLRVWNGEVIDGEAWFAAAEKLQLKEVPIIDLSHMTEVDARAYAIAIKRLTELGKWDWKEVLSEWDWLEEQDFENLTATAFDNDERERIRHVNSPVDADADAVPELQSVAVSKPGDVWVLGEHRLMCGSSTSESDVSKLLNGIVPHLMVTDPPYGVEYDAEWRSKAKWSDLAPGEKKVYAVGKVENDENADWREAWQLFPGDVAYIWHAGTRSHIVAESLLACGFEIRAQIIWRKNGLVVGRGHYHHQHEPCFYAVRHGKTGHWHGDRKQSTIWDIDKPVRSETGHSTQKPVECMLRPIMNNSRHGDYIYEPFNGSGSTIIAAEQCKRRVLAMELMPEYVDLAVRRWQGYTEQRAVHADTGEPFPDVVPTPGQYDLEPVSGDTGGDSAGEAQDAAG